MRRSRITFLIAGAVVLTGVVSAQQTPTDFSFMFDGYADVHFNHPDSGFNQIRNFDLRADTAHVNLLSRLEFRDEWSNQPFFQNNGGTSKNQPAVLPGLIAYIAPNK
jgi:hypothetical protein